MDILWNFDMQEWRNILAPLMVWFNRWPDWKIYPLYWNKSFKSKRNIDTSWIPFNASSEDREVNLLTSSFVSYPNSEIRKSRFRDLLPQDLRDAFASWSVLQTQNLRDASTSWSASQGQSVDLYKIWGSDADSDNVIFSQVNNSSYCKELDKYIYGKYTNWKLPDFSKYLLLLYSDISHNDNWRTGVLMEFVDWNLKPVVIPI